MDKQVPAPGMVQGTQLPQRLNRSLFRQQSRGIPSRDSQSFHRDSSYLPDSNLFRVPRLRGRVRFPNLHALHRRGRVYTYYMADSMSFSPFSK